MGIQINGQTDTISASDGGLSVSGYELTGASNINVTGIVTATGLDVTNIKHPSFGSNTFVLDSSGNINIDSGGVYYDASNNRLAIGTTTPGSALEVKPSASLSTIGIQAGTINSDSIRFQAGGTVNTYLEYRGYLGHAWFVDSTERLRITSDAYVRLASGTGGIQFNGDTAAANALDDYEEGTFTPGFGVSNGNITYSNQWGKYVKIGSVVYIWFRLVATNDANATLYYLTDLPFTISGISEQYPGPCISNFYNLNIGTNATVLGGYWRHNETRFRFHSNGNNTNQLTPTLTASSSFEIRGEGFYPTV